MVGHCSHHWVALQTNWLCSHIRSHLRPAVPNSWAEGNLLFYANAFWITPCQCQMLDCSSATVIDYVWAILGRFRIFHWLSDFHIISLVLKIWLLCIWVERASVTSMQNEWNRVAVCHSEFKVSECWLWEIHPFHLRRCWRRNAVMSSDWSLRVEAAKEWLNDSRTLGSGWAFAACHIVSSRFLHVIAVITATKDSWKCCASLGSLVGPVIPSLRKDRMVPLTDANEHWQHELDDWRALLSPFSWKNSRASVMSTTLKEFDVDVP